MEPASGQTSGAAAGAIPACGSRNSVRRPRNHPRMASPPPSPVLRSAPADPRQVAVPAGRATTSHPPLCGAAVLLLLAAVAEPRDPSAGGAERGRVPRVGEPLVKDFKPRVMGELTLPKGRGTPTLTAPTTPGRQAIEVRGLVLTPLE